MNEHLTNQIVAALIEDGTIKMTGEEIATAIASAVADLGKEYRFLGVATPGLAPGSILTPTLYVAVAVGSYGPFSNQSVDVGQIAFFTTDDGAYWEKAIAYDPAPSPSPTPTPTPGSGLKVIVSTADWGEISEEGVEASTKAEAAQIIGITEDELDFLLNGGDATPCLFVYGANGGSPDNYAYSTKGAFRGQMEEGKPYFQMADRESPSAGISDGAYVIYGFGL